MPGADEIQALKQALADAQREADALRSELRVLRTEHDLLVEQLNRFKRKLFDARSEAARASEQKDLFFDEAESLGRDAEPPAEETEGTGDDRVDVPAHQRRVKRGRRPLDPALPREVVRHELPEGERVCPHDGAALVEIGAEVSEQLDIIPQQVRVIRHERVKYACPCCDGGLRLAAKPPRVIPRGLLTDAALAWVITAKYLDGLPLYRQAALLSRFGGTHWSRNTLASAVVKVGAAVQPVINLMRDALLESLIVHGDETEVQVLKEPGRRAQAKSYMWALMTDGSGRGGVGPPIRLFGYAPSRSTETAAKMWAGLERAGALMTDGYEPYDTVAKVSGRVHLGCWAHCRRYFHEAMQALPKDKRGPEQLSVQMIELIKQLYVVEADARRDGLTAEKLATARQTHSLPVLRQIEELAKQHLHRVLPGSLLGQALHYLTGQWPKLVRYVEDGRYPIDNNPCENAIRPFVIGRRNWLFADTVAGTNASANLYSLLQTCVANGVEPYQYLKVLLTELPTAATADDYAALMPWRLGAAAA